MNEERVLLLEDTFKMSLSEIIDHLELMTKKNILRWGADHNGTTLLGLASGNDSCAAVITLSAKEVKGKIFSRYRLQVIGSGQFNHVSYSEHEGSRSAGVIRRFHEFAYTSSRSDRS